MVPGTFLCLWLQCRVCLLFGTRLGHLLNDLKREDNVANLAALAVPDQFHFALVLEQQKEKLVRQGLAGSRKAEDLLLFLFSQSRHETSLFLDVLPRLRPRNVMENMTSRNFTAAGYYKRARRTYRAQRAITSLPTAIPC